MAKTVSMGVRMPFVLKAEIVQEAKGTDCTQTECARQLLREGLDYRHHNPGNPGNPVSNPVSSPVHKVVDKSTYVEPEESKAVTGNPGGEHVSAHLSNPGNPGPKKGADPETIGAPSRKVDDPETEHRTSPILLIGLGVWLAYVLWRVKPL